MEWRDVLLAARRLLRRPVFAASSMGLIGGSLGIGVTIGSLALATLAGALPYGDEARLVVLYWSRPDPPIPDMLLSLRVTRELMDRSAAFDGVAATLTPLGVTLRTDGGPLHLRGGLATPQCFDVLNVQPSMGRPFLPAEGLPGAADRTAILSYEAWQRVLGGSREAVGTSLEINGMAWTVVGVLPPRRTLGPADIQQVDVWFPTGASEELLGQDVFTQAGSRRFRTIARLAAGVDVRSLPAELERVARGLASDFPETHRGWRLNADPLRARAFGSTDPILALLVGSVLFWLIALLNLFGLFVQRGEEDARATMIRMAVGASKRRIWWHRAADALVLGGGGAVIAVVTAAVGVAALEAWDPFRLPAHVVLALGWPHVVVMVASAFACALAVAAVAGAATDSVAARHLHGIARARRPLRGQRGPGHVALTVQVTICTLLTVGAVAAARSLHELRSRDEGVTAAGMLSARMEIPPGVLAPEEVARRAHEMVRLVREVPGIENAFIWSPELPTDAHTLTRVRLAGPAEALDDDVAVARYHTVSPGAVSALGLRVVEGRDIGDEDLAAGRRVALVSASAAREWWGGQREALGERIQRTVHSEWSEVVGVVADAPLSGRYGPGSDNTLDVYFMFDQDPRRTLLLFLSTDPSRADMVGVRAAVAKVVPELPLYDVRWMEDRLRDQERLHRSTAWLGGAYALASLLLAVVGLAGATALLVQRRRVEVGIRQALGASRPRMLFRLASSGMKAGAVGMVAGSALARYGLGRVDPVLLTVGPSDAASYLTAAVVLSACLASALVVPAVSCIWRPPAESLSTSVGRGAR